MNYGTLGLGLMNLVDWNLGLDLSLLTLWYWLLIDPLTLTFDLEPWLEPLIWPWHLTLNLDLNIDLDLTLWPWLLDPSVFYPGATCCGVATTITLMHQCYVLEWGWRDVPRCPRPTIDYCLDCDCYWPTGSYGYILDLSCLILAWATTIVMKILDYIYILLGELACVHCNPSRLGSWSLQLGLLVLLGYLFGLGNNTESLTMTLTPWP